MTQRKYAQARTDEIAMININLSVIIIFILTVLGTLWFFSGFHNVDLAYNFISVGKDTIDCNAFNCQTLQDGYTHGIALLLMSLMCFLSAIIIGFVRCLRD